MEYKHSRSLIAGGYELDGTEEALAGSAAERISQRERQSILMHEGFWGFGTDRVT